MTQRTPPFTADEEREAFLELVHLRAALAVADLDPPELQRRERAHIRQRNSIADRNAGLVLVEARRWARGQPERVEDLTQNGTIGLVDAIARFDPTRAGVRFATYAMPWIRNAIRSWIFDLEPGSIRVPSSERQFRRKLARAESVAEARDGRAPTVSELAKALDVREERVARASTPASGRMSSLDAPLGDDGDTFVDLLEGDLAAPDEMLEERRRVARARELLAGLPDRSRVVLVARYEGERTYDSIGEDLELSRERVRQIHDAALDDLFGACRAGVDGAA